MNRGEATERTTGMFHVFGAAVEVRGLALGMIHAQKLLEYFMNQCHHCANTRPTTPTPITCSARYSQPRREVVYMTHEVLEVQEQGEVGGVSHKFLSLPSLNRFQINTLSFFRALPARGSARTYSLCMAFPSNEHNNLARTHLLSLFLLGFDVFDSPSLVLLHAHLTLERQALVLVLPQAHSLFELKGREQHEPDGWTDGFEGRSGGHA